MLPVVRGLFPLAVVRYNRSARAPHAQMRGFMKKPRSDLVEGLVSFREFCRLVSDGQKADLIDGVIYMASPDSRTSNHLTRFITSLFQFYIEARNLVGEVYLSRFAFRLTKYRAPEPDVAYVRPERVHLVAEIGMRGGPDI